MEPCINEPDSYLRTYFSYGQEYEICQCKSWIEKSSYSRVDQMSKIGDKHFNISLLKSNIRAAQLEMSLPGKVDSGMGSS